MGPLQTDTAGLVEIGTNLLADPISVVLLLIGGAITGASVAVLGYLAAGAAFDAVFPETIGQDPPEAE